MTSLTPQAWHFGATRWRRSVCRTGSRAGFRALDTLRLSRPHQVVTSHEQVGERAGHEQAMGVLVQAPIADLGEAEHPLDHADGVLDLGAHPRLRPVLRALG